MNFRGGSKNVWIVINLVVTRSVYIVRNIPYTKQKSKKITFNTYFAFKINLTSLNLCSNS